MKRKLVFLFFSGLSLLSLHSRAAMGIRIASDRKIYLKYEHINLELTLRNDTGNSLDFRSGQARNGSLQISLIDNQGNLARQLRDPVELLDNLVLPAGATRRIVFSLNNYYEMARQSNFTIYAQIGHSRLSHDYRSPRIRLEVRQANQVWSKTFGLPSNNREELIKNRTASLLKLDEKGQSIYCLQIEDDDFVYAVHRIARHISGADPRGEIDAMSNIHIFIRIRSRLFIYQIFNYQGELIQEKYYSFDNNSPSLYRNPQTGTITVVGGRVAVRGVDYLHPSDEEDDFLGETAPTIEPL